MFGTTIRRGAAIAAAVTLATCGIMSIAATSARAANPAVYYVAMGDSLGAGTGASGPNAYVNRIYAHEAARIPGLQLENLSCGGATTASVLNGPGCGSGTQIAHAEAFLRAHPGRVAFLTIDIGGNDVAGCNDNPPCAAAALTSVDKHLRTILARLRAAYPGLRVFGMNYYDPFLASWLTGPSGQTAAQESVAESDQFNEVLTDAYLAAGFRTADVGGAFATDDFSLTGTYNAQTVPRNVANVCAWTHMCDNSDFHANDAGHGVIAATFEPLIDAPAVAPPPTAVVAVPGDASATLRWSPAAKLGLPAPTGYVVTPYLGTKALAARTYGVVTSAVVRGLQNGKAYTFRVATKNHVGTGARSAASHTTTAGTPLAPRAVHAGATKGSATVRWQAPVRTNGAPLTAYVVVPYLGAVAQKARTFSSTATSQKLGGLPRGRAYTFRVAARNARGTGSASAPSNVVEPT